MKTIAFIFARSGSKGLPGKNIKMLAGKPLIAWSINDAFNVPRIERVIVSTDSQEIAKVAIRHGAEVPFLRPLELASDGAPEWLAWRHAIEYIRKTDKTSYDAMVSIPTTAPLRLPEDINACLDVYEKGDSETVIAVADSHRTPYFNMVKKNPDGTVGLVIKEDLKVSRRQEAPITYDMTTICYVVNMNFVLKNNSIFDGRVRAINVPPERAIDIDTPLDFLFAETLMNKRLIEGQGFEK